MSTWLAIDSADRTCSVAFANAQHQQQFVSDGHRKNTDELLKGLELVLPGGLSTPQNFDGIAVTVGPGSFSGVRIGCVLANTIAYVTQTRLLPVSSCAAWAQVAANAVPNADYFAVAMDARMNQVYWALYQRQQHTVRSVVVDCLLDVNSAIFVEQVSQLSGTCVLVGSKWQNAPNWCPDLRQLQFCDLPISAAAIIDYARSTTAEDLVAYNALQPIYLRNPV